LPYERAPHWLNFFGNVADYIVRLLQPKRVLDAGCAMGFLVEALWDRGVEAWGIDISSFAISRARPDIRPYCVVGSIAESLPGGHFDLITCIEVLEHLSPRETELAIDRLCGASDSILFSSTPSDLSETTHQNVRPILSWIQLFAERGFYPDMLFDAQFLTPHAMLLRRREEPLPAESLVFFARVLSARSLPGPAVAAEPAEQSHQSAIEPDRPDVLSVIDTLESDISALKDWMQSTQASIASVQAALHTVQARLIQLAERDTGAPNGVEADLLRIEQDQHRVAAQVEALLNSRIWRTLQVGGGALLRLHKTLAPWRTFANRAATGAAAINLHCDTPPSEPKHAVTGAIEIRGWALADSGIATVEIQPDSESSFPARYGLPRPDLPRQFPGVPGAGKSGFVAKLDTLRLSNGLHVLTIRARAKSGQTVERRIPVLIDHEHGFASEYDRWLRQFERRDPVLIELKAATFTYQPLITVIAPVHKTVPALLEAAIESVLAQSYPKWQLCLVDDGSESPELTRMLGSYAARDSRIEFATLPDSRGISAASNRGLSMAKGEYVGLLDHDDMLAQDALFHVIDALQQSPRPDLIYSDEDHMDEAGRRFDPFFKPDWSPDLILAENYVCHFMVFERSLAEAAGGFRTEMDLSQDHDLLLRMSRRAQRIYHIPRVLYHWRTNLDSMQRASSREAEAFASSRRAVEAYLMETGTAARVEEGVHPGRWRVRYAVPENSHISIIIPSGGNIDVLRRNLNALFDRTAYTDYEVVIVDNSKGDVITSYIWGLQKKGCPIRVLDMRGQPFNFSRLNNVAVNESRGPLLLFLNDDTEAITPDWLTALVEQAVRQEVGAVGAKLLYPDGRIQHAGVTMGLAGQCGHSFKGLRGDQRHYFDFPDVIRNVSAVTGACLMTRIDVFRKVGGFDETLFPVAYNDIDLCLKIGAAGYRVIYTPHALLYHYEAFSKSRQDLDPQPAETLGLTSRWGRIIASDPFYNPNLTKRKEDFSLNWG
jgi:GT2 family glycosyltransferase/SAM-dependent methyltransferase